MAILFEKTTSQKQYVPIKDIEALMSQSQQMPYPTKFSMMPYLKNIKSKMGMACDHTKSALIPVIEGNQQYIEKHGDDLDSMVEHPHFKTLMSLAVPSLLFANEISYISPPFEKKFIVKTPAFVDLVSGNEWEVEIDLSELNKKVFRKYRSSLYSYFEYILQTKHSKPIW